ncbi:MAG: HAD-IA family hydrolase [Nakamurella sp.]
MIQQTADQVLIPAAGVLFDCDGVLVDSDASVLSAWSRWSVAHGLDPETVGPMVHGRRAFDTVALLIDEPGRAAAYDAINTMEVDSAATVTAIPGALELVSSIAEDRWAVVTSGNRILAAARLAAAGIPQAAVAITADDVTDGKPHPEGYRAAAAGLGLDPALTVVLEDANSGVLAARAAGVGAVIGVGERALETDADVVVTDLRGINWTGDGLRISRVGMLRGPLGGDSAPADSADR